MQMFSLLLFSIMLHVPGPAAAMLLRRAAKSVWGLSSSRMRKHVLHMGQPPGLLDDAVHRFCPAVADAAGCEVGQDS
jgi:hypothetical protein